ncbi:MULTISPECIES: DUF6753 family protein [unclassified Coleofasciculus]|uniref:DUF6753 family protein n=1 Tax=unclassified Coleofasciculus TaxID=2692782 RepID=UPI00187F48AE|nr:MULTISPECIES: DUF6753 family protein [unclassified Coleofasciculus]MBE9128030.1 hypothetical protein [Coleofasciculus sp. LEGE 07081]MBE9150530.1 hypothetical protein [Coleofasciculus sp. LEGE 07092]
MPENDANLLEQVLQDKDDTFKARVLQLVVATGIDVNDPVFLLLTATGRLEVMLEDAPKSLEKLLKAWGSEFWRTVELTESVVVERQKEAIARSAQSLIEQAPRLESSNQKHNWSRAAFPIVAIAIAAILGGFLGGIVSNGNTSSPTTLNAQDAQLLKWASSNEGKLAKNLVEWNAEYLKNRQCAKDVQNLGVELTVGEQIAKSGFCVLWVEPPNKREMKGVGSRE